MNLKKDFIQRTDCTWEHKTMPVHVMKNQSEEWLWLALLEAGVPGATGSLVVHTLKELKNKNPKDVKKVELNRVYKKAKDNLINKIS